MAEIEYRLPQKRELVTSIPGPKSQALAERRAAALTLDPTLLADLLGRGEQLGAEARQGAPGVHVRDCIHALAHPRRGEQAPPVCWAA